MMVYISIVDQYIDGGDRVSIGAISPTKSIQIELLTYSY